MEEGVPYFKNQYQVIILLLAKGINPLPYEIVLHILKDYVYVKPFRIYHMFGRKLTLALDLDIKEGNEIEPITDFLPD